MLRRIMLCCGLLLAICPVPAQVTGHYVNGVEGLTAATLPGPGLYYRLYNAFYTTTRQTGTDGRGLPVGTDIAVWAAAHRLIYITKTKFLGADYGMDVIIPTVNTNVRVAAAGVGDSKFGLGDIWVEPLLLGWHGKRYDAALGFGFYAPTGTYSVNRPASPGKNMWTFMSTFGGTVYFDPQKSWHLSALGRYEVHTQNNATRVTPGNDFHFEWGAGYTFPEKGVVFSTGLTGYAQWQVTNDGGTGVTWNRRTHDQVFAAGPEFGVIFPKTPLLLSVRTLFEFGSVQRTEGNLTAVTLTTRF